MRFTYTNLIIIAALVLGLAGCSTDVDINAPYNQLPTIYALLNGDSTYHTIRVTKLFQSRDGQDARFIAKNILDSFYFDSTKVRVVIGLVNEGNPSRFLDSIRLFPIRNNDKSTNGEFAAPDQYLYRNRAPYTLNPDRRYRIKVTNLVDRTVSMGETQIVNAFKLNRPSDLSPGSTDRVDFSGLVNSGSWQGGPFNLEFVYPGTLNAREAEKFRFGLEITFQEELNILGRRRVPARKRLVIPDLNVVYNLPPNPANSNIRVPIPADRFIVALNDFINTPGNLRPDDSVVTRSLDSAIITVNAISPTLSRYIDVQSVYLPVTQNKPIYTNVSNGLGVVGSVRLTKSKGFFGGTTTNAIETYVRVNPASPLARFKVATIPR